jgi:hypothetical protein
MMRQDREQRGGRRARQSRREGYGKNLVPLSRPVLTFAAQNLLESKRSFTHVMQSDTKQYVQGQRRLLVLGKW